jgi:curved DNA-binding protein CbpA
LQAVQRSIPDDDDDEPTGLLERPAPVREESGIVRKEIEPALLEKLRPVDDLYARLETADYYELLGLAPGATRQEIRKSYSQLARRFHPDVYFRKRIGDYRAKLERLFAAITRAYGVLIADEERRIYDLLGGFPPARAEPEPVTAPPSAPPSTPRVSAVVERVPVSVAPQPPRISMSAPAVPRVSSRPPGPSGADLAREALRRELSKRHSMPPRASGEPDAASTPPAAATLDDLIVELERGTGIEVWVAARLRETRARERNGELMAALNILQLVLTRFPDPRLREQCARLRERAVRGTRPR